MSLDADEIRFRVQRDTDQGWLLQRLGWLILGSDEYIAKDSGYQYMLGTSNSWWVSFEGLPDEMVVVLAYRYGDPEKMQALKKVILWLLGLEFINRDLNNPSGRQGG